MIALLLKSAIATIVFWTFYKLVLERESFFAANRIYLLGSMLLSFLIPHIALPELVDVQGILSQVLESSDVLVSPPNQPHTSLPVPDQGIFMPEEGQQISSPPQASSTSPNLVNWIEGIYFFGVAVLLLRLLTQLGGIIVRIIQTPDKIDTGEYILVNSSQIKDPCSFFRFLLIDPARYAYETYEQILQHEEIHIQKHHTIDLLLSEMMVVILWFNPFSWLLRREIDKNLEYQTDELVLRDKQVNKEQYQMNLLKVAAFQQPLSITTNYNQSLIKKRIIKMSEKKSNPHSYWKYAFIAPTVFMMLLIMNKPASFARISPATPAITIWEKESESRDSWEDMSVPDSQDMQDSEDVSTSDLSALPAIASDCQQLIDAILNDDMSTAKSLIRKTNPNCITKTDEYIVRKTGRSTFYMQKPKTPLVAAAMEGNWEIGRLLIEEGARPGFYAAGDQSPLMAAASGGHLMFVKELHRLGVNIEEDIAGEGRAVIAAARNGHVEIVQYLHQQGADIQSGDHEDDSPILVAARGGHTSTVRYLINQGVDMHGEAHGEGTPISVAARGGHTETVRLLLSKGADIHAETHGEGTPLSVAARGGHLETVSLLLSKGANIHAETHGEGTPLSVAARGGHVEVVQFLIEQGADINAESHGEGTPLSVAARGGHLNVVKYLIRQGADINAESHGEGTPLSVAARGGHLDVVDFLLSEGADINSDTHGEGTALSVAARGGHTKTVKFLISKGADIDAESHGEGTPLSVAARGGHTETVQYLLSQGADINGHVSGEGTPLSVAARGGHLKTVKLLVSQGAEIDAIVHGEGTALICAVKGRHYEVAKYLLEQGADPYLETPGDEYAMYHAKRSNDSSLIRLLETFERNKKAEY